jgi:hypothetical protein
MPDMDSSEAPIEYPISPPGSPVIVSVPDHDLTHTDEMSRVQPVDLSSHSDIEPDESPPSVELSPQVSSTEPVLEMIIFETPAAESDVESPGASRDVELEALRLLQDDSPLLGDLLPPAEVSPTRPRTRKEKLQAVRERNRARKASITTAMMELTFHDSDSGLSSSIPDPPPDTVSTHIEPLTSCMAEPQPMPEPEPFQIPETEAIPLLTVESPEKSPRECASAPKPEPLLPRKVDKIGILRPDPLPARKIEPTEIPRPEPLPARTVERTEIPKPEPLLARKVETTDIPKSERAPSPKLDFPKPPRGRAADIPKPESVPTAEVELQPSPPVAVAQVSKVRVIPRRRGDSPATREVEIPEESADLDSGAVAKPILVSGTRHRSTTTAKQVKFVPAARKLRNGTSDDSSNGSRPLLFDEERSRYKFSPGDLTFPNDSGQLSEFLALEQLVGLDSATPGKAEQDPTIEPLPESDLILGIDLSLLDSSGGSDSDPEDIAGDRQLRKRKRKGESSRSYQTQSGFGRRKGRIPVSTVWAHRRREDSDSESASVFFKRNP